MLQLNSTDAYATAVSKTLYRFRKISLLSFGLPLFDGELLQRLHVALNLEQMSAFDGGACKSRDEKAPTMTKKLQNQDTSVNESKQRSKRRIS